jgi:hypothetical protein
VKSCQLAFAKISVFILFFYFEKKKVNLKNNSEIDYDMSYVTFVREEDVELAGH